MTLAVTENCRTQWRDFVSNETASSNGLQDFLASGRFSNGNGVPYRHYVLTNPHGGIWVVTGSDPLSDRRSRKRCFTRPSAH